VVEPNRHDGRVHAWAIRFVNSKTLASHPARKQERVNLLRVYALLVQEKILRDPESIHVSVAEFVPRSSGFVLSDRWPDYFSAATYWSSEALWRFIRVPYGVLDLALRDVAREFRARLREGLKDLLPLQPTREQSMRQP
jgi:hypothetical protein